MSKKIVYVINVDWYFRLHWLERAEYFKSLGFDIYIISSFSSCEIKKELASKGFICHQLSVKRKSVNILREVGSILRLKGILDEIEPDLIHCVTIKPNVYAGLLNRLFFNKPIIYSVTGLGAVFSSNSIKFNLLKYIITTLYKCISISKSRFIFENSEDYKLFDELGVLKYENGRVVKGAGIDLARFSPSLPPLNKNVLFGARLLKEKGLACLVEAKQILESQGVEFTLNVAGIIDSDVSSAIPLSQVEAWASSGDINWLGNVENMPKLIKENDIVCLPTTYGEGVPRILIEAASCQRAIITTDVVGCREIVSHNVNGLLARPGDVISLASCLRTLLESDDKTLEFGVQGRKKVEEEFSQEMVFEKTLKVYEEISTGR
ncbi:glycosyltransferase family 4 protein [Vibrio crassostreae]|uniref:Glycosyl transferase n=1 Tax=Vibrio crassostreae TaxID=246167 RepID=A0ABM9QND8_9VIBR|nr:glycosyltransferase family 4 protein [Vibrio crassostreae]TCL27605.1 glycosyltransferase involved in cell wall biosynthesis [Vibrio crassostreae]TCT48980.1 glycosyltransferase involved in cell wall biosynthesis [Vibrio crassostreae]TCT58596.1 glycosyltransferase involved in cell wall biosynthesis [Vibrio crassostreae]CAK1706661.1 Glycosyl transferase [Vibrio crassostreae]CAK1708350.1 Glycosyl transferase [Vibrio crassostreae]